MRKVFNFSPGPAMLPEAVLKTAQAEMLNWHGTEMSAMELPHRGMHFQEVMQQTESDLRTLLAIPPHYRVLFLPDGAAAQFTMVPLNLLGDKKCADYIHTGIWSKKALTEAERYGAINIAATLTKCDGLLALPPQSTWSLDEKAAYVHYAPNETIDGVQFHWVPETGSVPLVGDFSSDILSRPLDVERYGLIYASAQKNMGQAGLTVLIIREDLIQDPLPGTPTLYTYKVHAKHHSMAHTPPTYSWYITGLVLAWLKAQGGVDAIFQINQRKACHLYDCIDRSNGFYVSPVHPDCRSMMNVVYDIHEKTLEPIFLEEAAKHGLVYLKGHRLRGGIRASIYNAMPEAGVLLLADFMHTFMKQYG